MRNMQPDEKNNLRNFYKFRDEGTVDQDGLICPFVIWNNGKKSPQFEKYLKLITEPAKPKPSTQWLEDYAATVYPNDLVLRDKIQELKNSLA